MTGEEFGKRKEILVVEDDENILELIQIILTSNGYNVDCAIDGVVGLEKIAQKKYDLIILNIMMPRMDGYEVLNNLRKIKGFDVPIILETVRSETSLSTIAPTIDYLYKPFDFGEMLTIVERNINKVKSKKFRMFLSWNIPKQIKRALHKRYKAFDKKYKRSIPQPAKPEPPKPLSELMQAVGKKRKVEYTGD